MEDVLKIGKDNFAEIFKKVWVGKYPKVYFIRCGNYIKIGYCESNLTLRLSELQIGCPEKLEIKYVIPGTRTIEKLIHRKLKTYKYRGEWFKLNEEQLYRVYKESLKRNFDFRGLHALYGEY